MEGGLDATVPPSAGGQVPAQDNEMGLDERAERLRQDPRTNLEIVDVPAEHRGEFQDLEGALMHWFSKILVVSLRSKSGKERTNERFLLVTDCCVYVLESGGIVTRCHHIKTLKEVMTSRDNDLGLRFPDGPDRYDLMLIFNTSTERDRFIVVLEKIYQFFTDRPLNLKQVEILRDGLQLRKPDGWLLKIEPLIPKKLFLQQMEEQERSAHVTTTRPHPPIKQKKRKCAVM
eukprot:TRINITY_DN3162_c0_g1_i1.p2 TRINITY_DN3162_c0_g1~~TRINITY_DN3162_c0_g1_i1.p2  ORF type:complete len:231 (+),score=76.56 TRINITY_DN3162_c0_g1_i1:391-1083(+)